MRIGTAPETVDRGLAVCANKVNGVRACMIEDHFSAKQGVEDDNLNVICLAGCIEGPELVWDLVRTFLAANFTNADRHLRRLRKVAALEARNEEVKRQGGNYDQSGNDSISNQHDPHAFDRCGSAGEIRTSRNANGAGPASLYDLESRHAV